MYEQKDAAHEQRQDNSMKTMNEHIKTNSFKTVYLLFGEEDYLKKQYRDKLRNAIVGMEDTMNYSHFEGKGIDVKSLIGLGETLPFFSDRRLVVVENSGFFTSSQEELAEYIKKICETTVFIFVEQDVDKRNKLYKAVNTVGYVSNMNRPDERTLLRWISGILKEEGKTMTEQTARLFVSTVFNDMDNIKQELEKLICYTDSREEITMEDVKSLCTVHTENKIFDMIRAVALKKKDQALLLYQDLLMLKEPPLRILFLAAKQFNTLLQLKELYQQHYSVPVMAQRMGMNDYIVKKNLVLMESFSLEQLEQAVKDCVDVEERVKTGRLNDTMAVELIINAYSSI